MPCYQRHCFRLSGVNLVCVFAVREALVLASFLHCARWRMLFCMLHGRAAASGSPTSAAPFATPTSSKTVLALVCVKSRSCDPAEAQATPRLSFSLGVCWSTETSSSSHTTQQRCLCWTRRWTRWLPVRAGWGALWMWRFMGMRCLCWGDTQRMRWFALLMTRRWSTTKVKGKEEREKERVKKNGREKRVGCVEGI